MRLNSITLSAILLVGTSTLSAQSLSIDSLQTVYKNCTTDTAKVRILNTLCVEYTDMFGLDSAMHMGYMAKELAAKIKSIDGEAKALYYTGRVYVLKDNYSKALDFSAQAIKLFSKAGNTHYVALCTIQQGDTYYYQGDFDDALRYYKKALELHDIDDYDNTRAIVEEDLGNTCAESGDYELALTHLKAALKIRERAPSIVHTANITKNIGNVYYLKNDTNDATQFYVKAAEMLKNTIFQEEQCSIYNTLASAYASKKDTSTALGYVFYAIKLERRQSYASLSLFYSLKTAGEIYLQFKDTANTLNYYNEAFRVANIMKYQRGIGEIEVNMADAASNTDVEKLTHYYSGLSIQRSLHIYGEEAQTLHHISCYYTHCTSDIALLKKYSTTAIDSEISAYGIFKDMGNANGASVSAFTVGELATANDRPVQALNYYLRAQKIDKEYPHLNRQLARDIDRLGYIYFLQEDTLRAINDYFKAKQMQEDSGYKQDVWQTYIHMGIYYTQKLYFNTALDYYTMAYNKALDYYTMAYNKAVEVNDKNPLSSIDFEMGKIHETELDTVNAFAYYERAAQESKETSNNYLNACAHYKMASLYYHQGNYDEAEKEYYLALTSAFASNAGDIEMYCYYELSEVYKATNRQTEAAGAYEHYRKLVKVIHWEQ